MSGPRATTGTDSKQDYATPDDFMGVCKSRFGQISLDLAAHAGNRKHERYFAPATLDVTVDYNKVSMADVKAIHSDLVRQGATLEDAETVSLVQLVGSPRKTTYSIKNSDKKALAFDSLKQDWALHGQGGSLWLNCEFNDCGTWAKKCAAEAKLGATVSILLLTPASVGTNWFRDDIAPYADVYLLNGRLSFDGKNLYPKDCMLSHFYYHRSVRDICIWNWKKDKIERKWTSE